MRTETDTTLKTKVSELIEYVYNLPHPGATTAALEAANEYAALTATTLEFRCDGAMLFKKVNKS